jgi:hypothetical protein
MKVEHIAQELEQAVRQFGLEVRREQGNFRGGRCTVNGEDLVMLNKRHPPEMHVAVLADVLRDLPTETIFLRPAVRDAMEDAWLRHAEAADLEADAE